MGHLLWADFGMMSTKSALSALSAAVCGQCADSADLVDIIPKSAHRRCPTLPALELLIPIIGKYLAPYSDRFGHGTRLQRILWLPGMLARVLEE